MFHIVESDCVDDGNNFGYNMACDSDVNAYDTGDLKDLSKSGLGTAGREVTVNIEILVFLFVIMVILGAIGGIILKSKGLLGGKSQP